MPNPKTVYVKVQYTAILELEDSVSGISDESPLLRARTIISQGVRSLLPNPNCPKLVEVHDAHFKVGVHFPKEKKPRKKKA